MAKNVACHQGGHAVRAIRATVSPSRGLVRSAKDSPTALCLEVN